MPLKPTVLIVGAGASCDLGLPVGTDLCNIIAKDLDVEFTESGGCIRGNPLIVEALRQYSPEIRRYWPFFADIVEAMKAGTHSIDTYLGRRAIESDLVLVGKLAIVAAILKKESESKLASRGPGLGPDLQKASDSWHRTFLQLMGHHSEANELEGLFDNLTIICFNYDRCIEHYLFHALQKNYACNLDKAKELLNRLSIIHPYGTVGRLYWQNGDAPPVEFGATRSPGNLLQSAKAIRTFTESVSNDEIANKIHDAMQMAEVHIYLGFGFLTQNRKLLTPTDSCLAREVYMTTRGISDSDKTVIQSRLEKTMFRVSPPQFCYADSCKELFSQHHQRLLGPI